MALPRHICKVHPAIGIARVGNGDGADYFIGPEIPGQVFKPTHGNAALTRYKDSLGRLRPQAARFRLWEYELQLDKTYKPVREITSKEADIEWQVRLANHKAAFHKFDGLRGEKSAPAALRNAGRPRDELKIDAGLYRLLATDRGPLEFRPGKSTDPKAERWPVYPAGHYLAGKKIIDYLGELRADGDGRLIVIGGKGLARSDKSTAPATAGDPPVEPTLGNYANNDGWFDDVSDGPVTATVRYKKGSAPAPGAVSVDVVGAWVLVGPPDFAPNVRAVVSLYDLMVDVAAREIDLSKATYFDKSNWAFLLDLALELSGKTGAAATLSKFKPHFERDLAPILRAALDSAYVHPAARVHGGVGGPVAGQGVGKPPPGKADLANAAASASAAREYVFGWLRPPPGVIHPKPSAMSMPKLLDDNNSPGLALPITQFQMFSRWAAGNFVSAPLVAASPPRPADLDRAAMESGIGGAFYPGIEVGWQIRAGKLFLEPFRIDHKAKSQYNGESSRIGAGYFSRQMALPWQADFTECRMDPSQGNYGWWPSARPDDVFLTDGDINTGTKVNWARASSAGNLDKDGMRKSWYKLGVVRLVSAINGQVEVERNGPPIP